MKEEKIVLSNVEGQACSQNKNQGKFIWKYMADSTQMKSHGLCCGVLNSTSGEGTLFIVIHLRKSTISDKVKVFYSLLSILRGYQK